MTSSATALRCHPIIPFAAASISRYMEIFRSIRELDNASNLPGGQLAVQQSNCGETSVALAEERAESSVRTMERWSEYLDGLTESPVGLSGEFAEEVRSVWWHFCWKVNTSLRPPVAGPGGELGFVFSWNSPEFSLQIDIGEDGKFEWFYRNRKENRSLGSDDDRCSSAPEELVRLFVRHCL